MKAIWAWIVNAWAAVVAFCKKYWIDFALVGSAVVIVFVGKWWAAGILIAVAAVVALVETLKK
jgi:hypothetical protein